MRAIQFAEKKNDFITAAFINNRMLFQLIN